MTLYTQHNNNDYNNNKPKDLATPKIPRGLRNLPIASATSGDNGPTNNQLQNEKIAIERWWTNSRWTHTKRGYNGTLYK